MNSCTDLARKARQRRGARGAVMLEAVIVVSFLVLVFFLLVGVAGLYRAKLRALQEARYHNTLNATNGCMVDGPAADFGLDGLGMDLPDDSIGAEWLKKIQGVGTPAGLGGISRAKVTSSYGYWSKPAPPTYSQQSRLGVGGQVRARSAAACNPIPLSSEPIEFIQGTGIPDLIGQGIHEAIDGVKDW
jgi:hypothetical protein